MLLYVEKYVGLHIIVNGSSLSTQHALLFDTRRLDKQTRQLDNQTGGRKKY